MEMKARRGTILLEAIVVLLALGATAVVRGEIVFLDDFVEDVNSGRFVIEAEHYSSRSQLEHAGWWEVDGINHTFVEGPDEGQKTPTAERWEKSRRAKADDTPVEISGARRRGISFGDSINEVAPTGKASRRRVRASRVEMDARGNYMMAVGIVDGTVPPIDSSYAGPSVDYRVAIVTPGTYRLYVRWAAWDINSDSLYAYIVKSDGTALRGAGPDYFMYHQSRNGWYWDNRGIENTPYSTLAGMPGTAVWRIKEPGDYIIRVAVREQRTAVDTLVFQTSDLPAPGSSRSKEVVNITDSGEETVEVIEPPSEEDSELTESQFVDRPVENKAVLAVRGQLLAALEERRSALKTIEGALAREKQLYAALEEMLSSGAYKNITRWDVITAKQKVSTMIESEEQSKAALEQGIAELEGALQALGWSPPAPPELVAHWKFDEREGSTTSDAVGENDGSIHGAEWTAGLFGNALSFDGKDDYVDVPDDASLRFMQSSSFTISFWAMPASEGYIVCKMRGGRRRNVFGYQTAWSPKTMAFWFAPESSWKAATSVSTGRDSAPAGTWHHVAGVYADRDIKIYLNGELRDNKTFELETGSTTPDKNLVIGARSYDSTIKSFFGGKIDDVRIYDGALSDAEIWALYESGK
jgi:hypothetical protein